jgi:hypothetical protein
VVYVLRVLETQHSKRKLRFLASEREGYRENIKIELDLGKRHVCLECHIRLIKVNLQEGHLDKGICSGPRKGGGQPTDMGENW